MKIIQRLIEHKYFSVFIIGLIILNWIALWMDTSKTLVAEYWNILYFFDKLVIWIFTLEAILKISVYRKEYFKDWWNLFDFTIVIISLLPLNWPFQILRVLRLLRIISFIPQMKKIVWALLKVIPWMLSVSALLMLIFYIFAIMTTKFYWESFPEWFGTIWESFYTLFQIMTLESWSMWIVRPVMEVYPNSWILFITFVLIATFVMINLVIWIVVEAMGEMNDKEEAEIIWKIEETKDLTITDIIKLEKQIEELKELIINKK